MTNKRKIFNDPIYGFISCPSDLIFEIIQHPYFQRLRRIKQLGMAELVYPGALHTRFQHALGSMHLMTQALEVLQAKGQLIMDIEKEAAQIAVLLHDLGHGPFSHALEYTLLQNTSHEQVTLLLMEKLNVDFHGQMTLAIEIFKDKYHRGFFHQLVSSQLDMDRLDYLNRDSFFTGVVEGQIGADRILKMLNVVEHQLVIEEKGLLSVENFLNARRLMYWQVYLHKTSLCAETMLKKIFERVRYLIQNKIEVTLGSPLLVFIEKPISKIELMNDENLLNQFTLLDDIDIWASVKSWARHEDPILSYLSIALLNRNLFKIKIDQTPISETFIDEKIENFIGMGINEENIPYIIDEGILSNHAYVAQDAHIKILLKNGKILDISEASDLPTIKALSNIVKKYYLCYANDVYLQIISKPKRG